MTETTSGQGMGAGSMSQGMTDGAQVALNCHAVCVQTIEHCLGKGGPHAAADHVRLLEDCAQICAVSADFMLRNSRLHPQLCGVCADACDQCRASCESMNDSPEMQACIDACRRCAESCRRMAHAA